MTAPAAMPSEEDVARVIAQNPPNRSWEEHKDSMRLVRDHLPTARAILGLFAPILAENERQLRKLADDWDAYGVEQEMRMLDWRDRALAAMPSDADLERLVDEIQRGDQSPGYYVAAVRAVIDDAAKADWTKHGATEISLGQWKARALAAEAALAAERERCAQIAYRVCAETRHVTLGDKAAAAIRAQGE